MAAPGIPLESAEVITRTSDGNSNGRHHAES